MIKFLIEKEFKQLLRNSFLPKMILIFPCMIMILMPWAEMCIRDRCDINRPIELSTDEQEVEDSQLSVPDSQ